MPVPHSKWHRYYSSGSLPWDTRRPSSQLVTYTSCCADYEGAAAFPENPPAAVNAPLLRVLPPPPPFAPQPTSSELPLHICPRCQHLKPRCGGAALELACGTGASSVFLAEVPAMRVVGVDVVADAVAQARAVAAARGVSHRCAFVKHDVFALPSPAFLFEQLPAGDCPTSEASRDRGAADPGVIAEFSVIQGAACTADDAADDSAAAAGFDFAYDCQAFHALRDVDEAGYVGIMRRSAAAACWPPPRRQKQQLQLDTSSINTCGSG